jgi:magnesium-transporting ATPase (P-type)
MASLSQECQAIVITGVQLETFDEAKWKEVLSMKEVVFARTTPAHKLKIVEQLQGLDHIVAVTGDGGRSRATCCSYCRSMLHSLLRDACVVQ